MDSKNLDYHYQTIKGRMAEALIEELFIINGYDVFRFGMENSVPGILKRIKSSDGKASDIIRKMPDLLVKRGDKTFLLEVKFRGDGKFLRNRPKDCPRDFPYRECFFIIVSKEDIKCISYGELTHGGKEIGPGSDDFLLSNRKEFSIDENTIKEFTKIVKMIYGGVLARVDQDYK